MIQSTAWEIPTPRQACRPPSRYYHLTTANSPPTKGIACVSGKWRQQVAAASGTTSPAPSVGWTTHGRSCSRIVPLFQLFLCLSRACLGKDSVLSILLFYKVAYKRRFRSTMERRRLEGSGKCERCDPGITTKPPSLGPTSWNCARINSMARGGSLLIATCNFKVASNDRRHLEIYIYIYIYYIYE